MDGGGGANANRNFLDEIFPLVVLAFAGAVPEGGTAPLSGLCVVAATHAGPKRGQVCGCHRRAVQPCLTPPYRYCAQQRESKNVSPCQSFSQVDKYSTGMAKHIIVFLKIFN